MFPEEGNTCTQACRVPPQGRLLRLRNDRLALVGPAVAAGQGALVEAPALRRLSAAAADSAEPSAVGTGAPSGAASRNSDASLISCSAS